MIWALLLILLAAFAAPFVFERVKPEIDDIARHDAPGDFALLSQGSTHYRWHGPDDGPVIICIHGLTTPSYIWRLIVPVLAEAGYRVLTYDLYGRGFSDRPGGPQDAAFFIRQLDDLLAHQGITTPVTLFGYSMGGSIAAVYADARPDAVERVVLLAPAGMLHNAGPLAEFARKTPVFGDWLMLAFGGWELRRSARQTPKLPAEARDIPAKQAEETRWRGFLPAVLASQRGLLAQPLEDAHQALLRRRIPVTAIWGDADDVIPIAAMEVLAAWNPAARHSIIPEAGHALALTHADEVLQALPGALSA